MNKTNVPPAHWFQRIDEDPDEVFYASPRFVEHIDKATIEKLREYYAEIIDEKTNVLDLMSSWISHLPSEIKLTRAFVLKRLALCGLALFLLGACTRQQHDTDGSHAKLVPVKNGGKVLEYRGVRYADAPTGANRWKPPTPVSKRETLDEWPPICVQGDGNVDWYKIVARGVGADPAVIFDTPPTSDCLLYTSDAADE